MQNTSELLYRQKFYGTKFYTNVQPAWQIELFIFKFLQVEEVFIQKFLHTCAMPPYIDVSFLQHNHLFSAARKGIVTEQLQSKWAAKQGRLKESIVALVKKNIAGHLTILRLKILLLQNVDMEAIHMHTTKTKLLVQLSIWLLQLCDYPILTTQISQWEHLSKLYQPPTNCYISTTFFESAQQGQSHNCSNQIICWHSKFVFTVQGQCYLASRPGFCAANLLEVESLGVQSLSIVNS